MICQLVARVSGPLDARSLSLLRGSAFAHSLSPVLLLLDLPSQARALCSAPPHRPSPRPYPVRSLSVPLTPRQPLKRLLVLLRRLLHHALRHLDPVLALEPAARQPVAQELLVEAALPLADLVRVRRPEAAAVRRQDLVDEDDLRRSDGGVEAEFEFGVCDDYAEGGGVVAGLLRVGVSVGVGGEERERSREGWMGGKDVPLYRFPGSVSQSAARIPRPRSRPLHATVSSAHVLTSRRRTCAVSSKA